MRIDRPFQGYGRGLRQRRRRRRVELAAHVVAGLALALLLGAMLQDHRWLAILVRP